MIVEVVKPTSHSSTWKVYVEDPQTGRKERFIPSQDFQLKLAEVGGYALVSRHSGTHTIRRRGVFLKLFLPVGDAPEIKPTAPVSHRGKFKNVYGRVRIVREDGKLLAAPAEPVAKPEEKMNAQQRYRKRLREMRALQKANGVAGAEPERP